jgi:hypothetical protein
MNPLWRKMWQIVNNECQGHRTKRIIDFNCTPFGTRLIQSCQPLPLKLPLTLIELMISTTSYAAQNIRIYGIQWVGQVSAIDYQLCLTGYEACFVPSPCWQRRLVDFHRQIRGNCQ